MVVGYIRKNKSTSDLAIRRLHTKGALEITITAEDLKDVPAGDVEVQLQRYSDWKELTIPVISSILADQSSQLLKSFFSDRRQKTAEAFRSNQCIFSAKP